MPPSPTDADLRRLGHINRARLLQGSAKASRLVAVVALLVLWKQFGVPFWRAVEWCFVGGVAAYTALGTAAAVLLTLARVRPAALIVAQCSRLVSVLVFAALRYVYGLGPVQSAGTWALLYATAAVLVRRIERRARRQLLRPQV